MFKTTVFLLIGIVLAPVLGRADEAKMVLFQSYMAKIRNSAGDRAYRNLYYSFDDGRVRDVLQNGNLSCAYFVSSVLQHFGLLKNFDINVESTVAAMKSAGWQKVAKPVPGNVIVWERRCFRRGDCHMHIGFFIGRGRVMSMSSRHRFPVYHGIRDERRKVVEILRHPLLEPVAKEK
jgi:hypothetical protein